RQSGVALDVSVHPENLQLDVDADRFSQILLNLYLNAIQAMDAGGVIRVEAFAQEGEVVLRVSDSGKGIHPDHLAHVFDPYFTTKPEGVGLGLANVHKLVEAHGGDIAAESRIGNGTTFVMRFPAPEPEGPGDSHATAGNHERIDDGRPQ
ncbi:MAG: GHKL domain-containing protein, partial [Syntrophobacteraceae bacterium]|nr:GHKL domain-containing protein [Syntrophobacteraceae bacterium]